jgi:CIC family chloride channel protein
VSFLRVTSHPRVPERAYLVVLAVTIGLVTALGFILFVRLLQLATWLTFDGGRWLLAVLGPYHVILLPALGGLIVGPLLSRFAPEAKGSGVPQIMMAVVQRGGRIRGRVVPAKIVASALTVGSGGSAGTVGPMVQVGAGVGSVLGQLLKASDTRVRAFVACGVAAGLAATLNAPIAGAMFALEVFIGHFSAEFALIILASLTSSVLSRAVFGNFPSFAIPPYDLISERELIFYACLGVLSAAGARGFVWTMYTVERRFRAWHVPEALKPAAGGLLVGGMGYLLPQILGAGFPAMEAALEVRLPFVLLAFLGPAKMLGTALTLGSGGSGGVFAPSLFIGAMVGGVWGAVVHHLFPNITAFYGAYALVGMGATFGAAAQAPLTGILLLFEMTNDYRIILPLMLATILSSVLYRAGNPDSIYTLALTRLGLVFGSGQEMGIMTSTRVSAALTHRLLSVPPDMRIRDFRREVERTKHAWFPVVNGAGELVGVMTAQDANRAVEQGQGEVPLENYMTREIVSVTPLDTLHEVIRRFGVRDLGHLPVVDPGNPRRLVGIISRLHVLRAYNRELARRQDQSGPRSRRRGSSRGARGPREPGRP